MNGTVFLLILEEDEALAAEVNDLSNNLRALRDEQKHLIYLFERHELSNLSFI